jgi:hypothetical protein
MTATFEPPPLAVPDPGLVWVHPSPDLEIPLAVVKGLRKPLIMLRTGMRLKELFPYIEDARQNDLSPAEYYNWARLCRANPYDILSAYGGPDSVITGGEAHPALLFPDAHLL